MNKPIHPDSGLLFYTVKEMRYRPRKDTEETATHMGQWEEPVWKGYTFQLRDTLEN